MFSAPCHISHGKVFLNNNVKLLREHCDNFVITFEKKTSNHGLNVYFFRTMNRGEYSIIAQLKKESKSDYFHSSSFFLSEHVGYRGRNVKLT